MPDTITLPSDGEIRDVVGNAAFLRGVAYAREGRVGRVQVNDRSGTVFAQVAGRAAQAYQTFVVVDGEAPAMSAHCTCPVGADCKHAAAAVIAAREHTGEHRSGGRAWRRQLDEIVRAHHDEGLRRHQPLGLEFEVATRHHGSDGRRVLLRPVTAGRRARWIRSGTSWQEFAGSRGAFPPDQHDVVHRLQLGSRDAGYPGAAQSAADLDRFAPSLWRLLAEARTAGITLVAGPGEHDTVRLADRPAHVWLDARDETGAVRLTPAIDLDGERVLPAGVRFIGSPPHGLIRLVGSVLHLVPLAAPLPAHLTRLVTSAAPLDIPSEDAAGFWDDYYPSLRQVVTIASGDDSVELPARPEPGLALSLELTSGPTLTLQWSYVYRSDDVHERHVLDAPAAALRDPALERELLVRATRIVQRWSGLLDRHGTLAASARLNGTEAIAFAEQAVPVLRDAGVEIEDTGSLPDLREATAEPLVSVSTADTDAHADWFDLRVDVTVAGEAVPFDSLFTALARGDTHLVLDSGTYFSIDRPELHRLRDLIDEARTLHDHESEQLRISTYQAGLWEELVALGVVDAQSDRWRRTVSGLLELDSVGPAAVPSGVDATLRPYQVDGFRWLSFLREHDLGGILADDMGLGKTLQTLAAIAHAHESGVAPGPFLVVAPTSVVQNWAREAERFTPGLTVRTVTGTQKRRSSPLADHVEGAQVVITSYALFRLEFDAYDALTWAGLVLDEAQFVKNHRGKSHQCARRLEAPFKLAITGTPLENNLMELWALLSVVAPGLFPHPERFKETYRNPIERGRDAERLAALRQRIRPLLRRRTKEQVVAELPPKQEQVLEVALESRHRELYQTHLQRERQKILGLLDDLDQNRFTILRSLTLLRQLSLDPYLVDEQHAGIRSSKIDALARQLSELAGEGHRSLVFSQFTRFLGRVRDRLDADGVSYAYLDGRTRDRRAAVEEFKYGDAPVFLVSLKAGGFGLNLTEADYCFVLDPWWNPAVEQQAVDRTHRIGQTRTVMVYRLVAQETIEEKVMELKARKQDLFARVMDDDGAMLSSALSASDIRGLLGVE